MTFVWTPSDTVATVMLVFASTVYVTMRIVAWYLVKRGNRR